MKDEKLLGHDPLSDTDTILSEEYYGRRTTPGAPAATKKPRPTHYKVICISMYNRDLARMDALVEALKSRGVTKANRSALIRAALDQVDLDKIPRGM